MAWRHRVLVVFVLAVVVAGCGVAWVSAQQIHRNGFEGRDPVWIKGTADAPFRELSHTIADSTARNGQHSEYVQISAEAGTSILYYYPTSKAPITDDLSVSLWLKSNRPGIQLMARVVMPKERNPSNLDEPLTTMLRGDVYQSVGRWSRMELRRPSKLSTQQQQILRADLKRDIDFTGAFVDKLVLNLYSGPGMTELWIDDLEIGPVEDRPLPQSSGPVKLIPPGETPRSARPASVELDNGHFLVNGKRFFFRGIRHSDTPLKVLRDAGLNTIWFDYRTSPAMLDEAAQQGFWLVPTLPATENVAKLTSTSGFKQDLSRFVDRDSVLFYDVGGGLTEEQTPRITQLTRMIRSADPQRPIGGDAWDGLSPYSRNLDLVGAHRWPLLTGLELPQYRQWLNQRRLLTRSGTFFWTWIQTHLPDWYTAQVYNRPASAGFDEPIGPQPEQLRLLAYTALTAGCRGLAFWSDRFLADSHQGRDRLLALALLNQEIRMLEPLLLTAEEPVWIDTSSPEVKAAVFRCERGVLVLPIWLGKGAQFVPGQSATAQLNLVVPQVPMASQAWEVSPGMVRTLRQERVVGGTRITIPEFSLTSAVVFTADNSPQGLVVRFQEQARNGAKVAAQWSYNMAEEEIKKVIRIHEELEKAGHPLPDGQKLIDNALKRLAACEMNFNRGDYREATLEAQRALRPMRILMRAQWEQAIGELTTPTASPFAVSFFTLPRHWQFMSLVRQGRAGGNALRDGDFEVRSELQPETWTMQETTLDAVNLVARRVPDSPHGGQQCVMLQIQPKNAQQLPEALERTFLGLNSPPVKLDPGSLVKISGWVKIPQVIRASVDGVLLYDSAGGEPLAVRLTEATDWKEFVLYRRVPATGSLYVTLALTGLGTAYFDDIRIEPMVWNTAAAAQKP